MNIATSIVNILAKINMVIKKYRFSASCHGFTLLEILAAMLIMSISILSIYTMHSQTIEMSNRTKFETTAPLLAQQKMAEMDIKDDLNSSSGDFGEEFVGYTWSVSVEDIDSDALGDDSGSLKKIDLTVNYDGNNYSYPIRAYRFYIE